MKNNLKYIKTVFFLSICFVLIWPAIYNGYPLVYSDSATYIASGFTEEVPIDRPLIYGLFVRQMSMDTSLWLVIIAQLLIVTYTIYMLVRKFASNQAFLITTGIIVLLSFLTGISNFTSQLMPDIYSAVFLIGVAVLMSSKKMRTKEYVLAIIVVFSAMTHLSNVIVLLGMTIVAFGLLLASQINKMVFFRILVISCLPIVCTMGINKNYGESYQISRASNVFLIARLIEVGVVKDFLEENCEENNYILCKDRSSIPDLAYRFIWNEDSPLYDGSCIDKSWTSCWSEKNDDFGKLIKDVLKVPKYRNQVLVTYSKDFVRQNLDFEIGPLTFQGDGSSVNKWVAKKFGNEHEVYKNARQYEEELKFTTISRIQQGVVFLSILAIILFLVFYKKLKIKNEHLLVVTMLFSGILGNALTVIMFSTVLNRYQSRVIWVIPLIAILLGYQYRKEASALINSFIKSES